MSFYTFVESLSVSAFEIYLLAHVNCRIMTHKSGHCLSVLFAAYKVLVGCGPNIIFRWNDMALKHIDLQWPDIRATFFLILKFL